MYVFVYKPMGLSLWGLTSGKAYKRQYTVCSLLYCTVNSYLPYVCGSWGSRNRPHVLDHCSLVEVEVYEYSKEYTIAHIG